MNKEYKTVYILLGVTAIAGCVIPLMMLIGSIIGAQLAPSPQWATAPIALMVIGTAMAVIPVTRCMARIGRKYTLTLFLLLGVVACFVATQALASSSFVLLCTAGFLLGCTQAALQQLRFAAMESVPAAKAPTAASLIMCAGIVSAFLGPELALWGKDLSVVEYRGSFWLGALFFFGAGVCLMFYRAPVVQPVDNNPQIRGRTLAQLTHNRTLILAVASGAIAFIVMSFVMTATPISMHIHHGHSLEDTKFVLQSHIAAMYLPSLLSVWLLRFLGVRGLMLAGLGCYGLMIIIGLINVEVIGFWGQLVMLGIGWNFLFISGTTLLPETYEESEKFRVQGLNDATVFSTQAVASMSAGVAISLLSWQNMLLMCLIPITIMAAILTVHRLTQKQGQ
jgi:MFS family permease